LRNARLSLRYVRLTILSHEQTCPVHLHGPVFRPEQMLYTHSITLIIIRTRKSKTISPKIMMVQIFNTVLASFSKIPIYARPVIPAPVFSTSPATLNPYLDPLAPVAQESCTLRQILGPFCDPRLPTRPQ